MNRNTGLTVIVAGIPLMASGSPTGVAVEVGVFVAGATLAVIGAAIAWRWRSTGGMPPRWMRRLVIAPLALALLISLILFVGLTLPAIAFASRYLPGRLRALGLVWLAVVWIYHEVIGLLLLFGLWVVSGFGALIHRDWFRDRHVRLLGWYLWALIGACQRNLGLRIVTEEAPGALVVEPRIPSRPVLLLSRHAGAGDSFILMHLLVNTFVRTPSVVLKDALQWVPSIDITLNRFPNAFISPNPPPGGRAIDQIGRLAAELDDDGALVIFPEGGNFTPGRRTRAIRRLEELGLDQFVGRARELTTVLPPRPGGVLRALDANPDADVVVVAHSGLEGLSSATQVLTGLPMQHSVRLALWHVRREDVPTDPDARTDWLYEWWERIDTWIIDHQEEGVPQSVHLDVGTPTG